MNLEEIEAFYAEAFDKGQEILRMVLDNRDAYIEAKRINPFWSELTLKMAEFNHHAMRMKSTIQFQLKQTLYLGNRRQLE